MAAATVAPGPAGAWHDEDPEPPYEARIMSPEEAFAQDAQTLAQLLGVSVDQMAERLRLQVALDELREAWPAGLVAESYAGARMVHDQPAPGAVLYFKGEVPALVRSQVEAAGLDGVRLVGGQRYTLGELEERQRRVLDALARLELGAARVSLDLASQRVEAKVAPVAGSPLLLRAEQVRDAVVADVAASAAISSDELEIEVLPAGSLTFTPEHGYGGAGIRPNSGPPCTSAFSVRRNSDGLKGYVTAGHCEGITTMEQNNFSGGVDLLFSSPFVAEHIGFRGEMEWHYTTHDSFPEFWSSHTARRTVYSRIANTSIDEGDAVCRYGRTTGYSCGIVVAVSGGFVFNWAGCNYCEMSVSDMVIVSGATSAAGDSGGPWFYVNTAYGIHFGADGWDFRYFSKIQNAEIQFGLSVMMG